MASDPEEDDYELIKGSQEYHKALQRHGLRFRLGNSPDDGPYVHEKYTDLGPLIPKKRWKREGIVAWQDKKFKPERAIEKKLADIDADAEFLAERTSFGRPVKGWSDADLVEHFNKK